MSHSRPCSPSKREYRWNRKFNKATLPVTESYYLTLDSLPVSNCLFLRTRAIKIAGLGSSLYFSTAEYVFDFVVTIVSILDSVLFISDTCGGSDSAFLRLVR